MMAIQIKTPTHTPALKISPITWQPDSINAIRVNNDIILSDLFIQLFI